mmetsp:Transcript_50211/g.93502  ORF Transcript_50211/g.93502 Transcript_50211/m.93502 type:complete len:250 (+) Transcript_50211:293-1042(+)
MDTVHVSSSVDNVRTIPTQDKSPRDSTTTSKSTAGGKQWDAYSGIDRDWDPFQQVEPFNSNMTWGYWDTNRLLHRKAKEGVLLEVRRLLKQKDVQINFAAGQDFTTALHMAVADGHTEVVKELVRAGANVNAYDKNLRTVLHYAVTEQRLVEVKILLLAGANPDFENNRRQTPVHAAAEAGMVNIVKALIEGGARLDTHDEEGRTPLQCAADNNHDEVVDLINGAMAFHNSTGKPVCGCGFFEWVNGTL